MAAGAEEEAGEEAVEEASMASEAPTCHSMRNHADSFAQPSMTNATTSLANFH